MENFFKKLYTLVLIVLVIYCLLLVTGTIEAQDTGTSIAVYPHTFDLQVLPGEIIEQKVKIFNQSEFPIPMTTRVVDFGAEDLSGQMIFEETLADPALASRLWFKVENPDFILDPGETEKVRFQMKVPDDAEPGGYYAVMIFEPRFPSFYFGEESTLKSIPEIGVLFLTSVQRFTLDMGTEQKLQVLDFSLSKEKRLVGLENLISKFTAALIGMVDINIVESSYLDFILRIKNNDIYHIKPSGRILIYNSFGKEVGETKIAQQTILPGKSRIFPAGFKPEVSERLRWLPASIANFLTQNFFIGKYRAKLELIAKSPVSIDMIQMDVPIVLTFFSLPWKFWIPTILIFGVTVLLSLKYRERIKKAAKVLLFRQRIVK